MIGFLTGICSRSLPDQESSAEIPTSGQWNAMRNPVSGRYENTQGKPRSRASPQPCPVRCDPSHGPSAVPRRPPARPAAPPGAARRTGRCRVVPCRAVPCLTAPRARWAPHSGTGCSRDSPCAAAGGAHRGTEKPSGPARRHRPCSDLGSITAGRWSVVGRWAVGRGGWALPRLRRRGAVTGTTRVVTTDAPRPPSHRPGCCPRPLPGA